VSAGGELEGSVAIVTGGHSGIGLSACRMLAAEGAAIAIFGRSADTGAEAVAELRGIGADVEFVPIDLADPGAIEPAVQQVVDRFGGVDILVNNAGARAIGQQLGRATVLDIDLASWDHLQAVNLRAPFLLTQAAARHMVEQGRGGRIVNVTSSSAFLPHGSAHYAASKAGLTALTRNAAADLGPHGITVNAVAPALTRTQYRVDAFGGDQSAFEKAVQKGPMANMTKTVVEPEDVAAVILFLCLPRSRSITAQTIHTDAGIVV
jgi:NAD(P)-dependent dehydrogenase (short-subunit alcohol dehydrogenase family)